MRYLNSAVDLRQQGITAGNPRFKELLHTGQSGCNVGTCYASRVECLQRQLSPRFTDTLSSNDPHSRTHPHQLPLPQIPSVAVLAHAELRPAGQRRANMYVGNTGRNDTLRRVFIDFLVTFDDDLTGFRITDRRCC